MFPSKPLIRFEWDSVYASEQVELQDSNQRVICKESIGPYKNVLGKYDLQLGNIYYWEIHILRGSYFKIGVIRKDETDLLCNTLVEGAFSDFVFGWSFYSPGQLRHQNYKEGPKFGILYGKGDTVGVRFDRIHGTLAFFVNDLYCGVAFHTDEFLIGEYSPAVACLLKDESFCMNIPDFED